MRRYEWLRIAAYVICEDDDGRVLLTRWIDGDRPQWTLAGSRLDHGEHPQVGVLRELTEETGYAGRLDELMVSMSNTRSAVAGRPRI